MSKHKYDLADYAVTLEEAWGTIGRLERQVATVRCNRAHLAALVREVMEWHADPKSADYNDCETTPCPWCVSARKAIGASVQQGGG